MWRPHGGHTYAETSVARAQLQQAEGLGRQEPHQAATDRGHAPPAGHQRHLHEEHCGCQPAPAPALRSDDGAREAEELRIAIEWSLADQGCSDSPIACDLGASGSVSTGACEQNGRTAEVDVSFDAQSSASNASADDHADGHRFQALQVPAQNDGQQLENDQRIALHECAARAAACAAVRAAIVVVQERMARTPANAKNPMEPKELAHQQPEQPHCEAGVEPSDSEHNAPVFLELMVRLPNGRRLRQSFQSTDTVGAIYDLVDASNEQEGTLWPGASYCLATSHPRITFENRSQTLADAGMGSQLMLHIEQKR